MSASALSLSVGGLPLTCWVPRTPASSCSQSLLPWALTLEKALNWLFEMAADSANTLAAVPAL